MSTFPQKAPKHLAMVKLDDERLSPLRNHHQKATVTATLLTAREATVAVVTVVSCMFDAFNNERLPAILSKAVMPLRDRDGRATILLD